MTQLSQYGKDQPRTTWPDFLKRGREMLYGEYQPDQEMKEFRARWGGVDRETFMRVLAEGKDEDRLLAICCIGESNLPQARTLLLPFLQSVDPKERWLSALYLGGRKEQRALPVLITMLTEYVPSEAVPTPTDMAWFDHYRGNVVSTLRLWEDASLVVAFRRALATSVNAEQYLPDHRSPRATAYHLTGLVWISRWTELCFRQQGCVWSIVRNSTVPAPPTDCSAHNGHGI